MKAERMSGAWCALALLLVGGFVATGVQAAKPVAEKKLITEQLRSGNEASLANAESRVWQVVKSGNIPAEFYREWLPALIGEGKNYDAVNMAFSALMVNPRTPYMEQLLFSESQAFFAMKQFDRALEAAKVAYCFSTTDRVQDNVENICKCLAAARPEDKEIGGRFRSEHMLGAVWGGGSEAAAPSMVIFNSIVIDSSPYEISLKKLQGVSERGGFGDLINYGNLLIVAGKGGEAESVFRQAFLAAGNEKDLDLATESIVRALRAQDGCDARGNAWIVAMQKQI